MLIIKYLRFNKNKYIYKINQANQINKAQKSKLFN